ncbi:MAG: bifunctional UDP-N-acetylglucosamine pyrophosphorylase / Glucosamine-1-phosphate N-acetyltransferase [Parcubacteria group bacterium Gr01-1014_56]|nr:MAG: bifunctional UDP-N-acetylglucosamine pyrophosphorylase / Glucosamine-1-phosphate N-acetyltransferase [Parcubacteria group bacterium Gr01-1014_56]
MLQPIILAAGKGTRMKSELPKALQPIGGEPMLSHMLNTLESLEGLRSPLIVVGHGADVVRETIGQKYMYVLQEDISGTASAVRACLPHLQNGDGVLVLYCDHPLLTQETIERMRDMYEKEKTVLIQSIVTVSDFNEWRSSFLRWGRIMRSRDGSLDRIVEYKNATEEERNITEVNPAIYCIDVAWLRTALPRIKKNLVSGEYYLTDVVELARADGKKIPTIAVLPEEAIGVNSQEDRILAERFLNVR